jgi:6,7-dimethyl-8-ribityllumazine synthase
MSGTGSPGRDVAGSGLRVAIVAASWHEQVMAGLIEGAQAQAADSGAAADVFRVPGSFELPLAAQRAADAGYDAVVALGVIIRGGTPHFDYVAGGVTQGLTRVALDTRTPIGFGVLTCDDEQQALDRAGLPGSSEDKGGEAMAAALSSAATLRDIEGARRTYSGFTPS